MGPGTRTPGRGWHLAMNNMIDAFPVLPTGEELSIIQEVFYYGRVLLSERNQENRRGIEMVDGNMVGCAQTVLGAVDAKELGITMMHEHLLADVRRLFDEPEDPEERALALAPITLETLSRVHMNWAGCLDNLVLSDPELAIHEAGLFKQAGGMTLVDVTNVGLGREPEKLRHIAERTGLHIIMGASYYQAFFHPPEMDDKSEDEICREIVTDITEGVDGTGIRAGIIGEIGCNWPLRANEAKVLKASARAQVETGAPISIHPGPHPDSPFEIMDILEAAGADRERVVMGHMERTGLDDDHLTNLAKRGCYLEFDWFGEVRPTFPHGRVDVPSDGERIKKICFLVSQGFGEKIVASQDVCMKCRLVSYGGPGYAHVTRYVQTWMREMGLGEGDIANLLINNPRRILGFV